MQNTIPPTNIPFENIKKGSSTTEYVEKLITFIEKYLPDFPTESNSKPEQNENDLSENLYKYLTRKAKFNPENQQYPFEFQPEKSQKKPQTKGHSKRIDIATRLNTLDVNMEVIYCIEAKKLPTDKVGGVREKEYVSGKGGAIDRFKREEHGLDDNGELIHRNGIIAYVTENSFDHWHININRWISECGWLSTEALKKEYFKEVAKLLSLHFYVSGYSLHLDHFWVIIRQK
ncbi:MAG: hypothetical protein JNL70_13285 [Saprospiraceae bacterium]|nr:hypothetical protein [Saprospiraceae bacterium]